MGTWGHQFDENDDAGDWLADFGDEPNWAMVEDSLRATSGTDYLEAPDASTAVAAAEVVAAARAKPSQRLPEGVAAWAADHRNGASALHPLAVVAVERIRDDSELAELWAESDEADIWSATLDDLLNRLNS